MTEPRRNSALDLLRAGSILYIVGYWHLLGYVNAVHGYKNVVTVRLTVVVLGLFTLMAGALAGRRPIRSAPEAWAYYRTRALRILPPLGPGSGALRSDPPPGLASGGPWAVAPARTQW